MSIELIRKSDILELIDSLNISNRQIYEDLVSNVEDMPPVKAVELPCKIGDKIYYLTGSNIIESAVSKLIIKDDKVYVSFSAYYSVAVDSAYIGETLFFELKDAKRAQEGLHNDT